MIAFVVEGDQEQRIIQRICPKTAVVLLGVNSESAAMSVIAKSISAHLDLFKGRYRLVNVVFDRERRKKSVSALKVDLCEELVKLKADVSILNILIADRTFENFIVHYLRPDGSFDGSTPCEVGRMGIASIGEVERRLKRSGGYHKTTVGVELFRKIHASSLEGVCLEFKEFRQRLLVSGLVQSCHWINQ